MNWKKFLFPPAWITLLLTLYSTAALIVIFVKGWEQTIFAYLSYAVAFYTLCILTAFCIVKLPEKGRNIKQKVYDNPFGNRFMTDLHFRTKVSVYLSFGFNLLYVGINILSYFLYRSWWFVVLAFYYGILSSMRLILALYVRRNALGALLKAEWKRSRICGYILLLVNLSLSGAVLMILFRNKSFEYHGILIYVMAMYTFYMTTHAIIDLIKYRHMESPMQTTGKVISLSAALVSMLSLETAMFSQFGQDMSPENQKLMIILTGAGVSLVIVTLSVLLIHRSNKEIRSLKNGTT